VNDASPDVTIEFEAFLAVAVIVVAFGVPPLYESVLAIAPTVVGDTDVAPLVSALLKAIVTGKPFASTRASVPTTIVAPAASNTTTLIVLVPAVPAVSTLSGESETVSDDTTAFSVKLRLFSVFGTIVVVVETIASGTPDPSAVAYSATRIA
jgi:hypothetical protein